MPRVTRLGFTLAFGLNAMMIAIAALSLGIVLFVTTDQGAADEIPPPFLVGAILLVWSVPALAQTHPSCTERGKVIVHLDKKYGEVPVAMGLANSGGVIEVLSSKTGESWTIIITMPDGNTCLIAAGENWEALPNIIRGLNS